MQQRWRKTSADPDWSSYKNADLNNDGKVDIEDLAAVAKKILERSKHLPLLDTKCNIAYLNEGEGCPCRLLIMVHGRMALPQIH
ncbi:dockerin type I domain-containing protein [Paenibacillus hexagrammi]|uniref:dockerin type I domain-containing protein n=1 Tax=Paenibacillus hexagrammi TaxID=2908839 RepID=UPI00331304C1